jgi:nicotinamidase-related amidase
MEARVTLSPLTQPAFLLFQRCPPNATEAVTVKQECDAFVATDLEEKLRKAGVEHRVVCGMQTEMCVEAAVRAAANRGFAVTLVSDAHTTFDTPELPAARIIALRNEELGVVATVIPSTEVTF